MKFLSLFQTDSQEPRQFLVTDKTWELRENLKTIYISPDYESFGIMALSLLQKHDKGI